MEAYYSNILRRISAEAFVGYLLMEVRTWGTQRTNAEQATKLERVAKARKLRPKEVPPATAADHAAFLLIVLVGISASLKTGISSIPRYLHNSKCVNQNKSRVRLA